MQKDEEGDVLERGLAVGLKRALFRSVKTTKNADVARCLLAMVIGCRWTQPMAVLGQIRVLGHGFYWP